MRLRSIDIFILLTLGILLIARSIWGIVKDMNVDLSKSTSITGKVVYAGTRKLEESTFTLKKYKTVFAIKLDNPEENFAVDRGASVCQLLQSQIQAGDTIKIYYRSGTGDFNTHVFQVEKDNRVVISAGDYSSKEFRMIALGFVFGGLITAGTIFWMIKQRRAESRILNRQ